jgi:predicted metal-dependent HD superfamily phosphohydrolase
MSIKKQLSDSWRQLAGEAGLRSATAVGARLIACYSEPHRVYHGLGHLYQVLSLLDELKTDPRLLLAAWFHDAIYRPGQADNEASSAEFARKSLRSCGYPEDSIAFVCDAVLSTASHRSERRVFDVLLDADLSILGASPEAYGAYQRAIRQEYAAVPESAFHAGRMAFVRTMLAQPSLYQTAYCQLRFELQARKNLQTELDDLLQKTQVVEPCN